jgi:ribosome maturation factor RimP
MSSPTSNLTSTSHPYDHLIQLISPWLAPLGYQVVHLEVQSHRQKILRVFIDFLEPSPGNTIGIEDCVKVSRTLDERLDQSTEFEALFQGTYELEISSPGVDRPLRTADDFERFVGKEVRIHVYRPMTGEELNNSTYQEKNPRQKNFLGTLVGLKEGKVVILVSSSEKRSQKSEKKGKAKTKAEPLTNSEEGTQVTIPLPLISKANLEPQFDFEGSDERE